MPRVLFIESHDSFSWNVIDSLPFSRTEIEVIHAPEALAALERAEVVVMGPGPTDPLRAGLVGLVREVARRKLPFLGVCLGHQALGLAFGATLNRSSPAHGKRAVANFSADTRFLPGDFEVMRYHSLSLTQVKAPLKVVATLDDGAVMAVEHESLPMAGVQFHPDSFGTPRGRELLAHWFKTSPLPLSPKGGEGQGEGKTPAEPVLLSSLLHRENFALLAPGFSNHGRWTLLNLSTQGTTALWYASAEGRAHRLTGESKAVELLFDLPPSPLTVTLDETGFLQGVTKIREHIAEGDVYQVNLTLRAELHCGSGAHLLTSLCRSTVPRFAAWVKSPAIGELVSGSPELLVETQGRWVHVEPMKGTAPPRQREWLEASDKDRAELAMITDLLRDDLHRLCEPGSVHVRNERRMIELPYVVQAVADVEGALMAGTTLQQVLDVVHPGGSVTGAPREAALRQIAALEATPRGAYCGALGLQSGGTARVALLIRTAERRGAAWRYGVGSGITWDSDPPAELEEVRLKLGALTSYY